MIMSELSLRRARPLRGALIFVTLAAAGCARTVQPQTVAPPPAPPAPQAAPLASTNANNDPIVQVVKRVEPAVVNVTTNLVQQTPFGSQNGQGVGTGFIVRSDGIVVTNYHVVEGAQSINITTPGPKSQRFPAHVI